MRTAARQILLTALSLPWLALVPGPAVRAHEIPSDVTVRIIVRPDPGGLQVLVRVPLEAMQDFDFPTNGPGFLDVERAEGMLADAAVRWLGADIRLFENGDALPELRLARARASIPSDRSFGDFDSASAHMFGEPLRSDTQLVWRQTLLDAWFVVPISSVDGDFSILPDLDRLGLATTIVTRFEPPTGPARTYQLTGEPRLIELDPRWHQAALDFVGQGFRHILDGIDHLLFLLCLVLPFRRELHSLIWTVTAFTAAHSITLIGSAFGLTPTALWFTPLVETLIAASILYMAIENVLFARARMRWLVAFTFGLVHGFGFSFALRSTMQFAGDHVLTSLVSFNVGIELGQLAVLAVLIPVLNIVFRYISERVGIIVISVIVGHTAWHWMTERYERLSQYPIIALQSGSRAVADHPVPADAVFGRSQGPGREQHKLPS